VVNWLPSRTKPENLNIPEGGDVDLSSPISSVIPSAHGPVLAALVRAGAPLSGRQVAALVEGQVSRSRVNSVLAELSASGLVLREPHPPSVLYELNRRHVAAEYIAALAELRGHLLARIREEVETWARPAVAVWMFGSAARGDGSLDSDIDILVIRPQRLDEDDEVWQSQLTQLAEDVRAWTGNACEVLELSRAEVAEMVSTGQRLATELRQDALHLGGAMPSSILRPHRQAVRS
jgi:predicted nucleotidyltransferase